MKPRMWPRWGQETFFGEISSLRFQDEAQNLAKIASRKLFLVKSLAQKIQDEAQDVAKIGSRKLSC